MSSAFDAEGESRATNIRVGETEAQQIRLEAKVARLDREIADTKDLVIKLVRPVNQAIEQVSAALTEMQSGFKTVQKQINKLFSMVSEKRSSR